MRLPNFSSLSKVATVAAAATTTLMTMSTAAGKQLQHQINMKAGMPAKVIGASTQTISDLLPKHPNPSQTIVHVIRPSTTADDMTCVNNDGDEATAIASGLFVCRLPKLASQLKEPYTTLSISLQDLRPIFDASTNVDDTSAAIVRDGPRSVENLLDGSLYPTNGRVKELMRNIAAAIDAFHGKYKDIALRVNVVRHPFSFRGGRQSPSTREDNLTWKWDDDLNIYAGDEIEQYLMQMGLRHQQVRQLRTPGGLRAVLEANDGDGSALKSSAKAILQVLLQISMAKGMPVRWTADNLKEAVALITPQQLGQPRGKQVSELDVIAGQDYKRGLSNLGKTVDIAFNFHVDFSWYPVDSQRVLLYAAKFASQEAYADALSRRHFTRGMSSNSRHTILDAAAEAGLDVADVEHMLNNTHEYTEDVWQSYRDTVGKHDIHSIPFFTFNGPDTNGGKFRTDGERSGELTVNGSGSTQQFLSVFERIKDRVGL